MLPRRPTIPTPYNDPPRAPPMSGTGSIPGLLGRMLTGELLPLKDITLDPGDEDTIPKLGLRRMLARLLDRVRSSASISEECEDVDDARRCLCMRLGSTSGIRAKCANSDRTRNR